VSSGKRLFRGRRNPHETPEVPSTTIGPPTADRHPRAVAHDVGERSGCLRVVVDPAAPTGVEDEPRERAVPERMSSPDRDVAAAPFPTADDRDGVVGLVAAERRGVRGNQSTHLGDDGFEHVLRRRP
jgi:hypothetical protein